MDRISEAEARRLDGKVSDRVSMRPDTYGNVVDVDTMFKHVWPQQLVDLEREPDGPPDELLQGVFLVTNSNFRRRAKDMITTEKMPLNLAIKKMGRERFISDLGKWLKKQSYVNHDDPEIQKIIGYAEELEHCLDFPDIAGNKEKLSEKYGIHLEP